jgi:hypothetical protein
MNKDLLGLLLIAGAVGIVAMERQKGNAFRGPNTDDAAAGGPRQPWTIIDQLTKTGATSGRPH